MVNEAVYQQIIQELSGTGVTLVAVSKTKPAADIQTLYDLGQRDFGENYVQELTEKASALPNDIRWHFIGHLQSNKVKQIAPFVSLIHSVDSFRLLQEINKQAAKNNRVIDVLLQMHIAAEETKFGLDEKELIAFFSFYTAQLSTLQHVRICGVMGMATATDDMAVVTKEYQQLRANIPESATIRIYRETIFFYLFHGHEWRLQNSPRSRQHHDTRRQQFIRQPCLMLRLRSAQGFGFAQHRASASLSTGLRLRSAQGFGFAQDRASTVIERSRNARAGALNRNSKRYSLFGR